MGIFGYCIDIIFTKCILRIWPFFFNLKAKKKAFEVIERMFYIG